MTSRTIERSIKAREQMDSDGARVVYRSIGHFALKYIDPFLMLDEFDVRPPGGFPCHPHRGYETVTYMLEGEFLHEDFRGHSGRIGPGDIQWISAAKGIVHKELPANNRHNHGFQLWINLFSEHKMSEPIYQEYTNDQLPHVCPSPGIDIKILAGTSNNVSSPIVMRTPVLWLEVKMDEGTVLTQELPRDYTAMIYVINGSARFAEHDIDEPHSLLILSNEGENVSIEASNDVHFFIIAGQPLHEPIVQLGPFVTNTKQEIYQSFLDYQNGRNGFQGAPEWISHID